MSSTTKLAITGASGRMGQRLIALSRERAQFELVAAIERADSPAISRDAGEVCGIGTIGLPITHDLRPTPDVLIDFTTPAATRHWLKTCRDRGIAMLIGTTGLTDKDQDAIDRAAERIPILHATNMSLGVAVLNRLVEQAATLLGPEYDIELVEAHHRFKKDAPSGTATTLLETLLRVRGLSRDAVRFGREGAEATRSSGEIGVHSLRLGDEIGTHSVSLATLGERVELSHRATSRDTFVHGALRAAAWLAGRPPGRYQIPDVLGL